MSIEMFFVHWKFSIFLLHGNYDTNPNSVIANDENARYASTVRLLVKAGNQEYPWAFVAFVISCCDDDEEKGNWNIVRGNFVRYLDLIAF